MSLEGLLLAIILMLGGLAVMAPMGRQSAVSGLPRTALPDNRELVHLRNRLARERFSRNWPEQRRSQFR